jgi:sarcosine oxidase
MGSAAAYHLARRGQRVLGLERHTSAHDQGSSHGESRIIRQAYFEDPAYVPLLRRAYDLWRQLEHDTGRDLLTVTGGLMLGQPDSSVITGSLRSAREHGLAHEVLDASEIQQRFPPLHPDANLMGLYETQAGFLRPEACVRAHLQRGAELGADLHFEEPALAWEADRSGDGVRVTTAKGIYQASRLVLSPGPWAPAVLADLELPLRVERRVMYWFDPSGGIEPFSVGRFPIYIWATEDGVHFYGFPASDGLGGGVKVALHNLPWADTATAPETIDREVYPAEVEQMRHYIADRIPTLNGTFLYAKTCMYTMTPDEHFVITAHPRYPQVALAAGFSGHGFKFASVVGEILADLAIQGRTSHPVSLFEAARF